jgi:MFS family permease
MSSTQNAALDLGSTPAAARRFRCWPVYGAAFSRTFAYAIYGIALPNFLIYFHHIEPATLGVIIAAFNIAFIFGPLVALPVARRIGNRNSALLAASSSVILVALQILIFSPMALILLRAMDGFFHGFFWPQLQCEVSYWQRDAPPSMMGKFFQKYAMSWNIGIMTGDLLGYVIVFTGHGNEFMALVFAWACIFAIVFSTFMMEGPKVRIDFSTGRGLAVPVVLESKDVCQAREQTNAPPVAEEKPVPSQQRMYLLSFPVIFYLIGTAIYQYLKNFYPFLYPYALNYQGIGSYWVYLVTFVGQAVQLVFIIAWTRFSNRSGYNTFFFSMFANVAFLAWLWDYPNVPVLTIAYIVNGALSGWLYNFTSRIMLEYGAAKKSLKYASLYEFFNGMGSSAGSLFPGLIASATTLDTNYPVTLVIVSGILMVLIVLAMLASKHRAP